MMNENRPEAAIWKPERQFVRRLATAGQLASYNDSSDIPVHLEVSCFEQPDIRIFGSKSNTNCIWVTHSSSGFVSTPRLRANFTTVRFINRGSIVYRTNRASFRGTVDHATIMRFDDFTEFEASPSTNTISATFATQVLTTAQEALTGGRDRDISQLSTVAEMKQLGMLALFHSVRQIHRRARDMDNQGDLISPLVEELLCYQLLSVWPKRQVSSLVDDRRNVATSLKSVVEYIQENLHRRITLSEIGRTTGMSVRTLQIRFKEELGQSPIQYIIDQRLARAHADLTSKNSASVEIQKIAKRWGFVHMSDFGQRYKRLYGCTPRQTRSASFKIK